MNCPRDLTALQPVQQGRITLDKCPGCEGLWFDHTELARIVGSWQDLPRAEDTRGDELPCPRGCGPMTSHFYSGKRQTVVDRCPQCLGVWLDRKELEAILSEVYPQLKAILFA